MSSTDAPQPAQVFRRAASPRRLRGDLRFLRVYALTTGRVLRYRPHAEALAASDEPRCVADRIEAGLAGEARRYRQVSWCILAILVGPVVLSAILWSGTYWLPVSIYWWPFERGNYGLPYFSLFEWLCFAMLAAYFAVTWGLLADSYAETRKLGTEYRRLLDADGEARRELAAALDDGEHPRAQYLVRHGRAFAAKGLIVDPEGR